MHHRRPIRLAGHDYAGGFYFVTVCTAGRAPLSGEVAEHSVCLSELGRLARDERLRTPTTRTPAHLDAFVVMPDHVHLGFSIVSSDCRGNDDRTTVKRGFTSTSADVAATIRGCKGAVARRIWAERSRAVGSVWPRGFHDHVVRIDWGTEVVRRYIAENPARWTGRESERDA